MSRGFDGFEIDDFHGPERDVNRSPESNNRAGWDTVRRLERIHGEEERADQRDREARRTSGSNRPPLPREERIQLVLARTSRTNYVHRNRTYQLRDSELHALTEVGKFRVLAVRDLAQFAFNGDSSRMQNDLANLSRQGLVKQTSIMDSDLSPVRAVTLTKEGHRALSYSRFLRPDQATYQGLKKPKEAFHDAELYRLYHKASDEIEGRGGKVVRVRLDYEIKRDLYADLARVWKDYVIRHHRSSETSLQARRRVQSLARPTHQQRQSGETRRRHAHRIANMKPRPNQFRMRENTASSRQHASRLGVNAAAQHEAAGEEERDVRESSALTSPLRPSQKSRHAFEPLIGSPEAAKLLGNIHVKTLQRYARTRRLPGYQIGGHWYFRASELDAWLHSRINSSCHPCRLNQEKSDGT